MTSALFVVSSRSALAARVFLFAVVLAGCQPIAPGPARYSCSRELPGENQCVNGWRCGLDGFCFDPAGANAVPLSCKDPVTDCPTGFKCGLEGTCFDPSAPSGVSLPCSDPLTHCPTGFKCGLDARCLAPDVAGPWRCEDAARDCTGGWACGALGLCFDRADAGRVACRAGIETDCNEAWRCGIDGLCQQRDAGAPWPCRDDSHCEAAWRCGPDETCLDPSADALRPNDGAPRGERFDFGWPAGAPDDVALDESPQYTGCEGWEAQAFTGAARFGRRVELFAVAPRGGPGLPLTCDGGTPTRYGPLLRGHVDFPGDPPLELAQLRSATLVRVDGGVRRFMLAGDQQVRELSFAPGPFKRMKGSRADNRVLAFGDRDVAYLDLYTVPTTLNTAPLVAIDGGQAVINDALVVRTAVETLLVAATDQGLFFKPLLGSAIGWTHVAWAEPRVVMRELRFSPQEDGGMPITVLLREASAQSGARVWTFHLDYDFATAPRPVTVKGAGPVRMSLQDLQASRGTHQLEWAENYVFCMGDARGWFQGVERESVNTTRVLSFLQCELPDGGVELQRTVVDPFSSASVVASSDQVSPMTTDARWTTNDDRSIVMVDAQGGLFIASTVGRKLSLRPWVPASAPEAASGRLERSVLARTGQRDLSLGEAVSQVRVLETHYLGDPDGGLALVDATLFPLGTSYRLIAGLEGHPDLSVVELPSPQGNTAVLVEAGDAGPIGRDQFQPMPALARSASAPGRQVSSIALTADGGLWFISQADQLLVAPVGPTSPVDINLLFTRPQLSPLPSARLAITPLPGAPITHVLGLPPDAATGAAHGQALVVAAGRLLHARADNPVVWRTTEPMETPSEIVKSWSDGSRVRVGARDGLVTSFPSRVALSPPLAQGARAWDFVDVCGVTYALASDGLWRLAARRSEPVGTWTAVPLPGGHDFSTQGALYTDGTGLLVFDGRGRTTKVTALTCAQPL